MGLLSWFKSEEAVFESRLSTWRTALGDSPAAQMVEDKTFKTLEMALSGHPLADMILSYVKTELDKGRPAPAVIPVGAQVTPPAAK